MSVASAITSASQFAWGQCTYYLGQLFAIPWTGNAKDWLAGAEAAGWQTTVTPAVGDIAVFQPGADGAEAPYGHVALVTDVSANGQFTVSEMNATAGLDKVDTRVVSNGPGVGFIVPPASADEPGLGAVLGGTPPNMLSGQTTVGPTTLASSTTTNTGILGDIMGALGFGDAGEFLVRAGLIVVGLIMFIVGLRIAFAAQTTAILQQGGNGSSDAGADTGFGQTGRAKISNPRPPRVPRAPRVARDAAAVAE